MPTQSTSNFNLLISSSPGLIPWSITVAGLFSTFNTIMLQLSSTKINVTTFLSQCFTSHLPSSQGFPSSPCSTKLDILLLSGLNSNKSKNKLLWTICLISLALSTPCPPYHKFSSIKSWTNSTYLILSNGTSINFTKAVSARMPSFTLSAKPHKNSNSYLKSIFLKVNIANWVSFCLTISSQYCEKHTQSFINRNKNLSTNQCFKLPNKKYNHCTKTPSKTQLLTW